MRSLALLAAFALTASGCFTVDMQAPYGRDVEVLPPGEPVEVTRRYQKWFAIWGIFPLGQSDNPRDIILREQLVEARVYTQDAIEDIVSGMVFTLLFPVGIILPQTVVVEGNRAPATAESSAPGTGER